MEEEGLGTQHKIAMTKTTAGSQLKNEGGS